MRVIEAAERILDRQGRISTLDLLLALGYLRASHIRDWKRGMLPHLEQAASADPESWARAIEIFHVWAEDRGLTRTLADYPAMNRSGVRYLRFTEAGERVIEEMYRTAYISPLGPRAMDEEPPEMIVYSSIRESQCERCAAAMPAGSFFFLKRKQLLCLRCAGLDDLVFVPAGNARLTRNARQLSQRYAIVLRYSRGLERYERKGLLVEPHTVDRVYLISTAILKLFPDCPPEDALEIASEFAPGQSIDEDSLRFAVQRRRLTSDPPA